MLLAPDTIDGAAPAEADDLRAEIARCTLCAGRFAATATRHRPRPVIWFAPGARILVASQAPGIRAHAAALPFWDRSGARLRDWLGIDAPTFYDRRNVAVLPASFCFPGYDSRGSDLPPPAICAETWHARARALIGVVRLQVLIGSYAQTLALGRRRPMTEAVRDWRVHAPDTFLLPHPSWRNNAWLRANPWFETELLPDLRHAVRKALA